MKSHPAQRFLKFEFKLLTPKISLFSGIFLTCFFVSVIRPKKKGSVQPDAPAQRNLGFAHNIKFIRSIWQKCCQVYSSWMEKQAVSPASLFSVITFSLSGPFWWRQIHRGRAFCAQSDCWVACPCSVQGVPSCGCICLLCCQLLTGDGFDQCEVHV